jgi:D-3-phosphoglycerate dehydrogenase / 2-oxoglutarate reductase
VRVLVTSKSFGRTAPAAIDLLKANGIEIVRGSKASMTAAEIAAEIEGFDALIVGNDTVDAGVFAAGKSLRLVHMHGTGLDAIDVEAASKRGVLVANAPGANRNAVAELTVGLILVAARAIDRHIEILKAGRWERTAGHEVSGKTIGMLGLGQIGRRIVELLSGFGVRVVAFDVAPDHDWAKDRGVELHDGADAVFAEADYLILALPLTADTRKFVDARRLALMKPSAVIVNTARGGLVDDDALCAAVRDKRIAGAALDVFDPEPLAPDSPLRRLGITLTPHLAATSIETAAEVSMIVARNVVDILVHGRCDSAVNPAALSNRSGAVVR